MGRGMVLAMSSDKDRLEALARERTAIESAITILTAHRGRLTEGQVKELKRIIYNAPSP